MYDSSNEKNFAMELDTSKDVAVYVKLPSGFYISTPVENTIPTGRYQAYLFCGRGQGVYELYAASPRRRIKNPLRKGVF